MNNLTSLILRSFFILVFFSITTFSFSQSGRSGSNLPDIVIPEDDGGNTDGADCLSIDDVPYTIEFSIVFPSTLTLPCNLQFGYTIPGQDTEYISPNTAQVLMSGELSYNFELILDADDFGDLCDDQPFTGGQSFEVNLYCLSGGVYTLLDPSFTFDPWVLYLCCPGQFLTDPGIIIDSNNKMLDDLSPSVFNLENSISEKVEIIVPTKTTYFLFDMYGNQVAQLNNLTSLKNIQDHISNLDIRSGIYFLRYMEGTTPKTKKVFKQ
ncbi:MAG: T9SS type A sorting domain-containing protein [Saprospiraceae bacterium]|nr:T9SS type A sorting domain-containing protein [Saprospiraceae bacterium]